MPHYYASVQPNHKVFKYAGYVNLLNEDHHRRVFSKYGSGGVDNPQFSGGPYRVIKFDQYEGESILEDGSPDGSPAYTSKQLILTKWIERDSKFRRMMWARKSSTRDEYLGYGYAMREGYIMHAFQVGDELAWDAALKRHEDIRARQEEA